MPRRRSNSRDNEDDTRQTYLAKPLEEVSIELADRIAKGTELKQTVSPTIVAIAGELDKLAARIRSWTDYNRTYLERVFTTTEIADDYVGAGIPLIAFGGRDTSNDRLGRLLEDLQGDIDYLVGLSDRLSLYVAPSNQLSTSPPAVISRGASERTALASKSSARTSADAPSEADDWAKANRRFLHVIFERFNKTGEWPEIPNLQRDLDRLDEDALAPEDINVAETARTMPVELGIRDYNPPRVWLKVRALATLPAAQPLLDAFIRVIRLAIQRYLASDGVPKLRRRDLTDELGLDDATARRVSTLLEGEPLVLGGGTGRMIDPDWERDLAPSFRELRQAYTIDSYLEAQARVLAVPRGTPPAIPRRVFAEGIIGSPVHASAPQVTAGALSLTLDDLHPAIKDACASRFASGHYADGVHQAAIAFRDLVRTLSGLQTLDGHELMSRALSDRTAVVAVADLTTQTGKSIQLGTMMLSQGAMLAIRNPVAHERMELDPAEAMEMVAVFSLLARRLEAVTRVADHPTNGSG